MSKSRVPVSIAAKVCALIWITGAAAALFFEDWRLLVAGFLAAFLASVLSAPIRRNECDRLHFDQMISVPEEALRESAPDFLGGMRRPKDQA